MPSTTSTGCTRVPGAAANPAAGLLNLCAKYVLTHDMGTSREGRGTWPRSSSGKPLGMGIPEVTSLERESTSAVAMMEAGGPYGGSGKRVPGAADEPRKRGQWHWKPTPSGAGGFHCTSTDPEELVGDPVVDVKRYVPTLWKMFV